MTEAAVEPAMLETRRGYTGHEHLDNVGLIHMNGRVYDPVLGRFLSADPYITDPTDSQSFNRYAYVTNNPLSFTDPSGFHPHGPDIPSPRDGVGDDSAGSGAVAGSASKAVAGGTGGTASSSSGVSDAAHQAAAFVKGGGGGGGQEGYFAPEEIEVISQYIAGFIMKVTNDYRDMAILCNADCPPEEMQRRLKSIPGFRDPINDPGVSAGVRKGAQIAIIFGIYGMIAGKGKLKKPVFKSGAWRLFGANRANIDPRKLVEYALNPNHPVGGNKAKVFDSALGFNLSNADDLLRQLQIGIMNNTPTVGKVDQYGARFTVDIPVTGPLGSGTVRTGWIYKPDSNIPEMTTLFVK